MTFRLGQRSFAVVCVVHALALAMACSDDPGPGSTVAGSGATGGTGATGPSDANISITGGTAGSGATGGGGAGGTAAGAAGAAGAGGGVPRTCSAPKQCPAKVHQGPFTETSTNTLLNLEGVTEITGTLRVQSLAQGEALSCLTTVGDNVEVENRGQSDTPANLDGLRSLAFVGGGIDIRGGLTKINLDCAFQSLESLGSKYLTGGAVDLQGGDGILDLSRVKQVTHIRVGDTTLFRAVLPSNATLAMGQLRFDNNPRLVEIAGFENVTLQRSGIQVSGTYSVRIVNNPLLSSCRAYLIRDLFVAAGFDVATMTISGNAPDPCS